MDMVIVPCPEAIGQLERHGQEMSGICKLIQYMLASTNGQSHVCSNVKCIKLKSSAASTAT